MKKTILLAYGILLPLFIFSQIGFQKFYGRPNTDQLFTAIVPLDDGGFLLGGTDFNTNGNGSDYWLVKTDSTGQEVLPMHFGTTKNEWLFDIDKLPSGGFLLSGVLEQTANKSGIYLINLNADLEIEWTKILNDNNNFRSYLRTTYIGSDGSIIIGLANPSTTSSDIQTSEFFRLFPDGSTDWRISPPQIDRAIAITTTADGHYLLHGSKFTFPYGIYNVLKMDINGSIIWSKEIKFDDTYRLEIRAASKATNSGGHVSLGVSSVYGTVVTKINDNGEIIWQDPINNSIGSPIKIIETSNKKFAVYSQAGIYEMSIQSSNNNSEYVFDLDFASFERLFNGFYSQENEHFLVGSFQNDDAGTDAFLMRVDTSLTASMLTLFGDFEPNHSEDAYALLQTPDNGFVMTGNGRFPSNGEDHYIIKTDSIGMIEWELNYNIVSDDKGIYDVVLSADSSLIFIGSSRLNADTTTIEFLKTDLNGNIISTNKYYDLGEVSSINCFSDIDSSCIISTSYRKDIFNYFTKFLKINNKGDTLWTRSIPHFDQRKTIYKTISTSDNHLVSIGKNTKNNFGWILKTDLEGGVIFDVEVDVNQTDYRFFYDVVETEEKNYLIPYHNENRDQLFLLEIAPDGTIIKDTILLDNYSEISYPHIDAVIDDEYLISFLANQNYFYSIHIGSNLEILNINEHNRVQSQKIADTQTTSDNSLAIFGKCYHQNSFDWYLIKTWPNGVVKTINIAPIGQISIYPNPSTNHLSINFQSDHIGPVEIIITNAAGQQLLHFQEEKRQNDFQKSYRVGNLPPGAYFIRLMAGRKSITRSWVKQ